MIRLALLALAISSFLVTTNRAAPHRAVACTGGGDPIEWASTHSDAIIIADATDVGDGENHAPAVTPIAMPSGAPSGTTPTPVPSFDFTGIGATMRLVRIIAGDAPATLEVDRDSRAYLERYQRLSEVGNPPVIVGNCGVGWFVIRYRPDTRYLLFIRNDASVGPLVHLAFPIDGGELITGDELFLRGNNGTLFMERTTYHQFFEGVPRLDDGEPTYLLPGRVPLASVLRVISIARGDPSIAPPDTGSAGLASGRR